MKLSCPRRGRPASAPPGGYKILRSCISASRARNTSRICISALKYKEARQLWRISCPRRVRPALAAPSGRRIGSIAGIVIFVWVSTFYTLNPIILNVPGVDVSPAECHQNTCGEVEARRSIHIIHNLSLSLSLSVYIYIYIYTYIYVCIYIYICI